MSQASPNAPAQGEEAEALTLREAQQAVDQWIQDVGVRYFGELTNMAMLTEEVGELARVLAREYGEQSYKPGKTPPNLGEEMADVLFVLVCLANQTGVDLTQQFRQGLAKRTQRDATRHQQNPKLKGDERGEDESQG
jgi:NTP pyrophosphatase (non-canonical NTP hydrolase)